LRFAHVFFDLDGTIIDPRDGIVGSFQYALNELGEPPRAAASLERFIGPPLSEAFGDLLATEDPDRIQRAIAVYRLRFGRTGIFESRVYDEMGDLLRTLSATGCGLWVVTTKPGVYAEKIIHYHGLRGYFRAVYGAELNGDRSDKAVLIRHVLQNEGLSAREVLMVGDRSRDVVGARANAVASVAVRWGYGSAEELESARPDAIVARPAELLEYVCGSGSGRVAHWKDTAGHTADEPRGDMG
jgi:phosphoglycolate phosphatase